MQIHLPNSHRSLDPHPGFLGPQHWGFIVVAVHLFGVFVFYLTMLLLNYQLLPCFSKQLEQKVSSELRHLPTEERLNSYFEE